MTPRLVATDADGTLLDHANLVSARTFAAVARVVAAGVPFVLVSGRPARTLGKIAGRAGVAGPAVCSNGAVVYDMRSGRPVRVVALAPHELRRVVAACDAELPGCSYAVESMDGRPALRAEAAFRAARPAVKSEAADRPEMLGRPGVKLAVSHPGMSSPALAAAVTTLLGDTVSVTYSQAGGLIEVSARGVDKGTGLAWLAGRLGVAAGAVAFGDMPNDIPMLRWAEHGVAVANAHPDVIAVAAEVTAANTDDGVALVLERWFRPGTGQPR
ncbi:haloacid dehalogenase [Catellatospora sp. IY07-71]|uniref:HAD family hydrolase n=1 Tax=Catellatospora sp. IY07-71 TaxID=2728827 RepID=UPI001BB36691|nr:HAD family hydrolase [Catellatospora sp. IY07-71]BCJ73771.1 haloacid dehalogenase [Catellatospora sp. IY07-71]